MYFALIIFLASTNAVFATEHSLSSDTIFGKDYFHESIGYQGRTANRTDSEWKWSLGYALSQSTTESNGTKLTVKTNDFSGGGGWKAPSS